MEIINAITIVYEEPDFVVIDKPSGIITHAKNLTNTSESVAGWALEHYPQIGNISDAYIEDEEHSSSSANSAFKDLRKGIVHRLDRETSGLLIIAKTQTGFDYLKKLFQERKIQKTYSALVYGKLKEKSGIIDAPLGKLGTRQTTQIHGTYELNEKSALTEYSVIQEFDKYTLLAVQPHTGRTHQIRVHLKSIGHPIVCDPLYAEKSRLCPIELGRLFLHAQKLEFANLAGQKLTIETDLPAVLANFLNQLKDLAKDQDLM